MTAAHTILQLQRQLADAGWHVSDLTRLAAAYELSAALCAPQLRGSGEPALVHLVRTASIVAEVDSRPDVVIAALAHASYIFGDFGDGVRGISPRRRKVIAEVLGEPAERIVAAYTDFDGGAATIAEAGHDVGELDPVLRDVVLIKIANEVEDHLDLEMRYRGVTPEELAADERLPLMVELAGRLGWPKLAADLEVAVAAELAAVIPPELNRKRRGQHLVEPIRIRATARQRLARSYKRVRRLLSPVKVAARRVYASRGDTRGTARRS